MATSSGMVYYPPPPHKTVSLRTDGVVSTQRNKWTQSTIDGVDVSEAARSHRVQAFQPKELVHAKFHSPCASPTSASYSPAAFAAGNAIAGSRSRPSSPSSRDTAPTAGSPAPSPKGNGKSTTFPEGGDELEQQRLLTVAERQQRERLARRNVQVVKQRQETEQWAQYYSQRYSPKNSEQDSLDTHSQSFGSKAGARSPSNRSPTSVSSPSAKSNHLAAW